MSIQQEVIERARKLVINQSRYIWPSKEYDDSVADAMYEVADKQTDENTAKFLAGKDIISDEKLIALVEKMGVRELYDDDNWIDSIADYIIENKADCKVMWDDILALTSMSVK